MKKIYFATKNLGKVSSLKRVFAQYGIDITHVELDLPEPRINDLGEIARQKVLWAYRKIKKPVVAQDSGFYIHSLNGYPGAFVKDVLLEIGVEGILKQVEGKSRVCEFGLCLAYYDKKLKEPITFKSGVSGILAETPSGKMKEYAWSPLFLVFIPEGKQKTLSEMTEKEYLEWSNEFHKSSYLAKFAEWLLGERRDDV